MSVIDDTRKLIQDFLAPELREIATRPDALEKSFGIRLDAQEVRTADRFKAIDKQFDEVNRRFDAVDKRFDAAERFASERHAQVLQHLQQLNEVTELKVRMARIEALQRAS